MFIKTWWTSISILAVLAIGLRFYQLGSLPSGIYWDEVAILVDAKSIANTGFDMHGRPWYQVIYPSYGDYKLPIYLWLAGVSVSLFGTSGWALRLPSALAGLATIALAGYCAYESLRVNSDSKNRWLPWLVAGGTILVVSLSPWSLMFSRTAFEGHLGQAWLALSVALVLTTRKWSLGWYLSPLLGALATYTYFSVRFVWPVVFVALWLWLESVRVSKSSTFPLKLWLKSLGFKLFLPLIIFGVCLVPMARSPLYGDSNRFRLGTDSVLKNETQILQSNVYRELAGNTPIDRVFFHRWWLTGRELLKNYSDNLSLNFLFVSGDPNLRHGTGQFGLFLWPLIPFFIWGWYQLFDKHRGLSLVLVVWWLAAALPASVPENTPHALRTLNALVPLAMVIGTGLGYGVQTLLKTKNFFLKASGLGWVLLFVGVLTAFTYHYFIIYPQTSAEAWQQGYPEVAQTIVKFREGNPVYLESFDDKFYLWLMAYGPYTGAEFKTWPSFKYQFVSFDGIFFSPFPGWDGVLNQSARVVIAGKTEAMEKVMAAQQLVIQKYQEIKDPSGQTKFIVIMADKKLW